MLEIFLRKKILSLFFYFTFVERRGKLLSHSRSQEFLTATIARTFDIVQYCDLLYSFGVIEYLRNIRTRRNLRDSDNPGYANISIVLSLFTRCDLIQLQLIEMSDLPFEENCSIFQSPVVYRSSISH